MKTEPQTADRMTLFSELKRDRCTYFVLNEGVFVNEGERYWIEDDDFVIERVSGEIERTSGGWETRRYS